MRRVAAVSALCAAMAAGCGGSGLGVGLPECEEIPRRPTPALILSAQAVPSAEYAPCIDEIPLGWDQVEFEVESGRAQFTVFKGIATFLTVTLTPSCDVDGAEPVAAGAPEFVDDGFDLEGVEMFTAIDKRVGSTIRVILVPTAERPSIRANALARDLEGTEVEERLVEFVVDDEISLDLRSRVNRAFFDADFVWLIDELDAVEGTVHVRRSSEVEVAHGVSPNRGLELMERHVEEPAFEGHWYFTFVGGCITYAFDAGGLVAETIEDDVRSAIGFYDLDALRVLARRSGVDIQQAPPPGE